MNEISANPVPSWVPEDALRYLAHTLSGRSIRDLARHAGCHASTVLRQIRRFETRRDDPLVDGALDTLARSHFGASIVAIDPEQDHGEATRIPPNSESFDNEAIRVLRRMCESGAVLAFAQDMEKAVVARDDGLGGSTRTAVVDCTIAQGLALKDWIVCAKPGRISRYQITAAGRAAVGELIARAENRARARNEAGMSEAQASFEHKTGEREGTKVTAPSSGRRTRYSAAESPLIALARRRDRDGKPFLDEGLVGAGERLREDFELAQMGPQVAQNWERLLTGKVCGSLAPGNPAGAGPSGARDRVTRALKDLGPGLSDVALRCCCYLEGLELAEKRMGWSARSGKIVLRIALQRLKRHYEDCSERDRLIG